MKRLLLVALLLVAAPSFSEEITGDISLLMQGRRCSGCTATIEQGYVKHLVHPEEGEWQLEPRDHVSISYPGEYRTNSYRVGPDYTYQKSSQHSATHLESERPSSPQEFFSDGDSASANSSPGYEVIDERNKPGAPHYHIEPKHGAKPGQGLVSHAAKRASNPKPQKLDPFLQQFVDMQQDSLSSLSGRVIGGLRNPQPAPVKPLGPIEQFGAGLKPGRYKQGQGLVSHKPPVAQKKGRGNLTAEDLAYLEHFKPGSETSPLVQSALMTATNRHPERVNKSGPKVKLEGVVADAYTGATSTIEDFPALNLFLIVATVLLSIVGYVFLRRSRKNS